MSTLTRQNDQSLDDGDELVNAIIESLENTEEHISSEQVRADIQYSDNGIIMRYNEETDDVEIIQDKVVEGEYKEFPDEVDLDENAAKVRGKIEDSLDRVDEVYDDGFLSRQIVMDDSDVFDESEFDQRYEDNGVEPDSDYETVEVEKRSRESSLDFPGASELYNLSTL